MFGIPLGLLFIGTVPLLLLLSGGLVMLAFLMWVIGATGRYGKAVSVLGVVTGLAVTGVGLGFGFIQGTVAARAYWLTVLYLLPLVLGVGMLIWAYPGQRERVTQRARNIVQR